MQAKPEQDRNQEATVYLVSQLEREGVMMLTERETSTSA